MKIGMRRTIAIIIRFERGVVPDIDAIAYGRGAEAVAVVGDAGGGEGAAALAVGEGFAFDAVAAFGAAGGV